MSENKLLTTLTSTGTAVASLDALGRLRDELKEAASLITLMVSVVVNPEEEEPKPVLEPIFDINQCHRTTRDFRNNYRKAMKTFLVNGSIHSRSAEKVFGWNKGKRTYMMKFLREHGLVEADGARSSCVYRLTEKGRAAAEAA